jgi:hypothetical protein
MVYTVQMSTPPPVSSAPPPPDAPAANGADGTDGTDGAWSDSRDSDLVPGDEESDPGINHKQQNPGRDEEGSESEDPSDRIPRPLRGDPNAGAGCCPF